AEPTRKRSQFSQARLKNEGHQRSIAGRVRNRSRFRHLAVANSLASIRHQSECRRSQFPSGHRRLLRNGKQFRQPRTGTFNERTTRPDRNESFLLPPPKRVGRPSLHQRLVASGTATTARIKRSPKRCSAL